MPSQNQVLGVLGVLGLRGLGRPLVGWDVGGVGRLQGGEVIGERRTEVLEL